MVANISHVWLLRRRQVVRVVAELSEPLLVPVVPPPQTVRPSGVWSAVQWSERRH